MVTNCYHELVTSIKKKEAKTETVTILLDGKSTSTQGQEELQENY